MYINCDAKLNAFSKVSIDAVFALRRKRNEMFLGSKSINNTKTAKNVNAVKCIQNAKQLLSESHSY